MSGIILDRDGVINHDSPDYIKSPQEWHPIDGSLDAIALMNQKGYRVFVATNQSGLARGYYTEAMLEAIHNKMHTLLKAAGAKVEQIVYCPHGPKDGCGCRKPEPGMLYQLQQSQQINLTQTPFVGDSWRDLQAGIAAGCQPILVKTGNGLKTIAQHQQALANIPVFNSLLAFAQSLPRLTQ